jgi:hypothetical protein
LTTPSAADRGTVLGTNAGDNSSIHLAFRALRRGTLAAMERAAWIDERLDDLSRRVDAGFARVDAELRELRGEIRGLGSELRGEIDALRITMLRVGGGVIVGLVGVIAAVLVSGV